MMNDYLKWNGTDCVMLSHDLGLLHLDAWSYGLKTTAAGTHCWGGIVEHYEIKNNQLYLAVMEACCSDGKYPPVEGVEATPNPCPGKVYDLPAYYQLDMPLDYTGTVIIGKHYIGSINAEEVFSYPFDYLSRVPYEHIYRLEFENGILKNHFETTEQDEKECAKHRERLKQLSDIEPVTF